MTRLCVISTSPSSSSASSYSIFSSFHLFLLIPFLLLFLFLPFGVATRQTQGGADGHDASRIQWQGPRVTLAIMRAGHAQPKSILNIKNLARQDALNASLYGLDRTQSFHSRHLQSARLSVGTMSVSHYTDVHRSKPAIARIASKR